MNLTEKLEKIKDKYDNICKLLSTTEFSNDRQKLISLNKERSELEEIVSVYDKYKNILKDINGNQEIINRA
jgi:peptide chain release factor 1